MSGESATSLQGFTTDTEKAAFVTKLWMDWDREKTHAIDNWKEVEAYRYATNTSQLPDVSNSFTHTTVMPELSHIAQDLEAILLQVVMPHEDWFTFQPMDLNAARVEQRTAIVSYLKNRHALNGLQNEISKLRSDYVTMGNCFAQVFHVDETKGDRSGYVGPKVQRISPYDIAFDPTGVSFKNAPKVIREIISLGELLRRGQNGQFDLGIVTKLLEERSHSTSSAHNSFNDKNEQYTPRGFGTYQQYLISGFIELLWFYGDVYDMVNMELHEGRMIVVADADVLLKDEEIQTADGTPHIYQAVWQKLPDNLWGMGPLENIVGLNYQINHRENGKSEALDRFIYPDKVYQGDVEEVFDEDTGQVTYLAPEGGGVTELALNSQFFSFDLHIDRLAGAMRSAARLPGDITGFRSQGEKTLGEVTALTDGGMRGFIDKAADFEINMLEPILKAEIELAHDHFGSSMQVPSMEAGGFLKMITLSKEDLAVNGLLVPKGARRFARKNQLLANLTQLSTTPFAQLALTHTSGKAAARLMAELLEVQDTGLFEDFAQITEQGEAQQLLNQEEQSIALASSQPGLEEEIITQGLEDL